MQLPDTSEWLCIETGLLRSQFASLAVNQLAASIVSILSSHSCPHDSTYTNTLHHFEVNRNLDSKCCSPFSSCRCLSQDRADIKGIPPQVLKELSDMCIPILHFPKALNVVRVNVCLIRGLVQSTSTFHFTTTGGSSVAVQSKDSCTRVSSCEQSIRNIMQ